MNRDFVEETEAFLSLARKTIRSKTKYRIRENGGKEKSNDNERVCNETMKLKNKLSE